MTDRPLDPTGAGRTPVRSYSTRFELDEDPLSEGGMWLNGRKDGIDWANIISRQRRGLWGRDPHGRQRNVASSRATSKRPRNPRTSATTTTRPQCSRANGEATSTPGRRVFSRDPTDEYFQEVEIRLRSTMTPHLCTGYEVFFRCLKTGGRLRGDRALERRRGDFTSLKKLFGPQYGVKDGDVIEAHRCRQRPQGFVNGVELISATDDTFDSGSPGIGFNFGVGDTNVDHGLSSFEVDTYDA